jgi:transposase
MTKSSEYDSPRRARFFTIYDQSKKRRSFNKICKDKRVNIPPSTGRDWIRKREQIGSAAYRRTRPLSENLGRPQVLAERDLNTLLDPNNPLNDEPYAEQAKQFDITAKTIQRNVKQRRGAQRFKKPYSEAISKANKAQRVAYGERHRGKTLAELWTKVYWTDECHFNSKELSDKQEYQLRQPRASARLANLQETRNSRLNVTVHVAAGISYDYKGPLIFYNDPAYPTIPKPPRVGAPRYSIYESDAEFAARYSEWKDARDKAISDKPKGNSMTQAFYLKEILPKHIDHLEWLEAKKGH